MVFKIHFFLFKIGIADYEKDVWKVNKKTEKEIPHDGEIKEVKEMSIEEKKPSVEQIMNRFSRCNTADVGEPGFGNNNYIKEVKE